MGSRRSLLIHELRIAGVAGVIDKTRNLVARIYRPAPSAMQSGNANTEKWVLDYEPQQPLVIEPLMGWTSSSDMHQQVRLQFETKQAAITYCEETGIPYLVFETSPQKRRRISYSDNFAYSRREPWTH